VSQLDFFAQATNRDDRKAGCAEDVGTTWMERENGPEHGSPEFRAIREMLHFVDYLKLNRWQQGTLWPWLTTIGPMAHDAPQDRERMRFELGYVIGALEVEQLRTRSEALEICRKYGVDI
jgi:hypothetical protein